MSTSPTPEASSVALARAITEAIANLNKLDDIMIQYDDKGLPRITAQINEFVGSLGKIKAHQESAQGKVPLELLARMDNEDLNPTVLALEALEEVIEELKSQERGHSMLQEMRSMIANETRVGEPPAPAPAVKAEATDSEAPPPAPVTPMDVST